MTVKDGEINFVIPCKIWDGIQTGVGQNSDQLKWFFRDELLFMKEKGKDGLTFKRVSRYFPKIN